MRSHVSPLPSLSLPDIPFLTRIGLDWECIANPKGVWFGKADKGDAVCFSIGPLNAVEYYASNDYRADNFDKEQLTRLRDLMVMADVRNPQAVLCAYNKGYDLGAANGILMDYLGTAAALPRLLTIEVMGNKNWGRMKRNGLAPAADRRGLPHKGGSPDWEKVALGDAEEWDRMMEYNILDTELALLIEKHDRTTEGWTPLPMAAWSSLRRPGA